MKKFIILISIYNDWKSVFKLLENIDSQISKWNVDISVLIVNDASTESKLTTKLNFKKIKSVRVVNMKKNQGHARCNATGLKFLTEKEDFDYVILMDGDGEDRPEELNLIFQVLLDRISVYPQMFFSFLFRIEFFSVSIFFFIFKFIT